MEPIRLLVIHRNRLFRDGLAFFLGQQQTISVVRVAAHARAILEDFGRMSPDVIILDVRLPGREGLGDTRLIREILPDVKIIVMSVTESESDVIACFEAGAAGFLPEEASLEDLLNNIQAVAKGEALCPPKVTGLLLSRVAEATRKRELREVLGLPNLTRRELEIISLIERGLSNKEIAVQLHIEIQTVKNHIHNILEKLHLDGRREAARYAREQGLLMGFR